jgi:hypothetical protein
MKRKLFLSKLKPEKVHLYKSYHQNVWPELESTYRKSGIKVVSCFLHDTTLAVYAEIDETVFEQEKARLAEDLGVALSATENLGAPAAKIAALINVLRSIIHASSKSPVIGNTFSKSEYFFN